MKTKIAATPESDCSIAAKVGAEIRLARKVTGLTQIELAEKSGVPQETISRLERGRSNPTLGTLERLARAIGVEINVSIG